MKLSADNLKDTSFWQEKGYALPHYDRTAMRDKTLENPVWLHFGAGNIFRSFPAMLQQTLLNQGLCDRGIIVCEGYDNEIIHRIYHPNDDLSVLAILKPDGSIRKEIIGSVAQSLFMHPDTLPLLRDIFRKDSLQFASFTITEKGYALRGADGEWLPAIAADMQHAPADAQSFPGILAALCYERFLAGRQPLALVSMDNCSRNGEKLENAVGAFARAWTDAGYVDAGFSAYVSDPACLSFPWSMIDKITPRPDEKVRQLLAADGLEDMDILCTEKRTYIAPFVNAEAPQYLVVEDAFPNGRPPLEKAGVIFTDRETVSKTEKMKVCTCLNPLHTALAIFGCLLSYTSISAEMQDPQLKEFVKCLGQEGMPAVVDPGILNPEAFMREVMEERFPNPFMPDTPQRIATDTSQKIPVRFGETLKAYQAKELNLSTLTFIPLVFAGWCRYLIGVGDDGKPMEISPDPLLERLQKPLQGIRLGDSGPFHEQLSAILSDESLFGIQLYDTPLAEKAETYFSEMIAGPGAVRMTLKKYLED